jgi:hypothetical protein
MQPTHPVLRSPEFRVLQDSLAKARSAQITQVVAAIDALETRGAADEVIAPLRPRLAQLRPNRPLRWSRLLFMPLNPLIVPTARWRPGDPTIPRTCLAIFSAMVRAGMGSDGHPIEAAIENRTTADASISALVGSMLWPAAARILAVATQPEGWGKTGLPGEVFAPLARGVADVLEQVLAVEAIRSEAELGVTLEFTSLRPILLAAANQGPTVLAMVVVLLLSRLPQSGPLLDRGELTGVTAGEARLRPATTQARAVLLARIEDSGGVEALVVDSSLADSAAEVRQINALLRGLRTSGSATAAAQREVAIRQRLDASCRTRFANGLASEFVEKLDTMGHRPDSAVMAALEATARNLRALESEARRVGSAELYDTLLHETAATVKTLDLEGMLGLVDKVRLVEILVGPDEALAVLEDGAGSESAGG